MTEISLTRPLVLASASPRRAELLAQLRAPFTVAASHIDEPPPAESQEVGEWARQIALDKARAAVPLLQSDTALIIGADTVVLVYSWEDRLPVLDHVCVQVLGKPRDADDARRMLRLLSGQTHVVLSAFALLAHPEGTVVTEVVETEVRFRDLSDDDIEEYVASGEPLDKAGAYGIQGLGAVLVDAIDGDYFTVVGLPLARLWQALSPWRRA